MADSPHNGVQIQSEDSPTSLAVHTLFGTAFHGELPSITLGRPLVGGGTGRDIESTLVNMFQQRFIVLRGGGRGDHVADMSALAGPVLPRGFANLLSDQLTALGFSQPATMEESMGQFMQRLAQSEQLSDRPVPSSVVSRLPVRGLTALDISRMPDECRSCAICIDEFRPGDEQMTLPCFHSFHRQCVEEWFHRQDTCPVCKHQVCDHDQDMNFEDTH